MKITDFEIGKRYRRPGYESQIYAEIMPFGEYGRLYTHPILDMYDLKSDDWVEAEENKACKCVNINYLANKLCEKEKQFKDALELLTRAHSFIEVRQSCYDINKIADGSYGPFLYKEMELTATIKDFLNNNKEPR